MVHPCALICDLDMTLIDSRRDIAVAVVHAVASHGGRRVDPDEVVPWIGKGLRTMITGLLPDATAEDAERITQEYKRYFYHHCNVSTTLYPGVVETLETLTRRGIRTAVASAKMTFMAKRVCEVLGLDRLMDHIQGTDDFPGKPDPTVLRKACDALEVPPGDAVFVGDTVMDVQAAQRAGCMSVAVTYGIGREEELTKEKPDRLAKTFSEIKAVFFGSKPA